MSLKQALEILKNGDVLVMQSLDRNRVFYNKDCDPDKTTFCFVNCTNWPELLDIGEWDWYIFQEGFKEQTNLFILNTLRSI